MSSVWETYVEQMMSGVDGHRLTSAAILGQDGTLWAQSAAFPQLKADQGIALMDINEQTGILVGSTRYMFISGESGDVILGKKGAGGICVRKTITALLVGIFDAPTTQEQCFKAVDRLGDYLHLHGF